MITTNSGISSRIEVIINANCATWNFSWWIGILNWWQIHGGTTTIRFIPVEEEINHPNQLKKHDQDTRYSHKYTNYYVVHLSIFGLLLWLYLNNWSSLPSYEFWYAHLLMFESVPNLYLIVGDSPTHLI